MNLLCKIKEKTGDRIVVEIESQQLTLSKNFFPESLEIGDKLNLFAFKPGEIKNKTLAKTILEEILNGK